MSTLLVSEHFPIDYWSLMCCWSKFKREANQLMNFHVIQYNVTAQVLLLMSQPVTGNVPMPRVVRLLWFVGWLVGWLGHFLKGREVLLLCPHRRTCLPVRCTGAVLGGLVYL